MYWNLNFNLSIYFSIKNINKGKLRKVLRLNLPKREHRVTTKIICFYNNNNNKKKYMCVALETKMIQ